MGWLELFRPRHETLAAKVLAVLTGVAAAVTLLFTIVFPSVETRTGATLTVVGCILLLALAVTMARLASVPLWLWTAYPFVAVAVIAVLDLTSKDATVTAQIFFVFPALYAGAQLRRRGAAAVCVAAAAADLVVTLALLPRSDAWVDASFMAAVLGTATGLLVVAGERNDDLIAQLERQAAIDPLTGLFTRRVLDSAASTALQTAAAALEGTALLLIDIDRFKRVNDIHGHPAGDAVLREVAALLTKINRRGDVVSRLGGDEIAVLLPACPLDVAVHRAEEIRQAVGDHRFDISGLGHDGQAGSRREIRVSVSVGVAHSPTHSDSLHTLYTAADFSLYDAKTGGRNRVGATPPPRSSTRVT
jgi:diguanylate cyclase (GGDEF)-like protein